MRLARLSALLLLLPVAACGDDDDPTVPVAYDYEVVAEPLTVPQFSSVDSDVTVTNTTLDVEIFNPVLSYEVAAEDEDIAYVDEDGVVTGLSAGTATITATFAGNAEHQATYEVTVTADPVSGGTLETAVEGASTNLNPGDELALTATFSNTAEEEIATIDDVLEITYTSSDEAIASVDEDGVVTAGTKAGTATITAELGGFEVSMPVTVTLLPVAEVVVTPAAAGVEVGATTTFTATAYDAEGEEALGHTFTWTSSNPAVASVTQEGVVTGHVVSPPGTSVVITATTGTHSASGAVVVTAATTP